MERGYSSTYIKKSQRYEERKSSAYAFLGIGTILLVFSLLFWLHVIHLPMEGFSKYLVQTIITLMGTGCLIIALSTLRTAKGMVGAIKDEEAETAELINWFITAYRKEELESQLTSEYPDLSEEEMSLKRFEVIQDLLTTNRDLPDQAYVDSLCEEIYDKMFEN